jgi:Zn-dependent metalloprotease
MRKLHPSICSVIPPHILRHIAEQEDDGEARASAHATLVQMQHLSREREAQPAHALVSKGAPSAAAPVKHRNVYDTRNSQSLPGKLVMSEHRKRGTDVEVNEAFDGAGAALEFFARVFSRDSIDGRGTRVDSTVHYGHRFDNAFWNGRQMIFGDGDGRYFNRFTAAVDVIGHELTHWLTQSTAGLKYEGQPGALNEHISDSFGQMIKQYLLGLKAHEADWLIGKGLFTPAVKGQAIRSMAAPGTAYDDPILGRDPQPGHMRGYVETTEDNGGVHINSGIPNHAFYLAAIALDGETWSALGSIWFTALTTRLEPTTDFQAFADATTEVAGALYGVNGPIQNVVHAAWVQVGITPRRPFIRATVAKRPPMPIRRATKWSTSKWRSRPARKGIQS